jgi:hypothetical protein
MGVGVGARRPSGELQQPCTERPLFYLVSSFRCSRRCGLHVSLFEVRYANVISNDRFVLRCATEEWSLPDDWVADALKEGELKGTVKSMNDTDVSVRRIYRNA